MSQVIPSSCKEATDGAGGRSWPCEPRCGDKNQDELLACVPALYYGDNAQYATAASSRSTNLRISTAYALAWGLEAAGARVLHFGGVSYGSSDSDDPPGGISDFKRYFSTQVAEVGQEWVLNASPVRARVAGAISASHGWLSRVAHRSS